MIASSVKGRATRTIVDSRESVVGVDLSRQIFVYAASARIAGKPTNPHPLSAALVRARVGLPAIYGEDADSFVMNAGRFSGNPENIFTEEQSGRTRLEP